MLVNRLKRIVDFFRSKFTKSGKKPLSAHWLVRRKQWDGRVLRDVKVLRMGREVTVQGGFEEGAVVRFEGKGVFVLFHSIQEGEDSNRGDNAGWGGMEFGMEKKGGKWDIGIGATKCR